jgi:hypothetical protein
MSAEGPGNEAESLTQMVKFRTGTKVEKQKPTATLLASQPVSGFLN